MSIGATVMIVAKGQVSSKYHIPTPATKENTKAQLLKLVFCFLMREDNFTEHEN